MKEIKFRAWDKNGNCMLPWSAMMQTAFNNGESSLLYDVMCGHRFNVELMQFTGLKDRNGVEIYESDIVNYHFVEDHLSCTVMWNEDRCCFGFKDNGEDVIYGVNVGDVAERAEVIGNIYQHKELLE